MSIASGGPGSVVGGFRIARALDAEGLAYSAVAEATGQEVVIRLPRPRTDAGPEAVGALLREAKALAGLAEPGLVRVLAAGVDRDRPFVVTEAVAGESLREKLARQGPLACEEALLILGACAESLGRLHRAGLPHGDVNPSHVLLSADRGVLLGGFASGQELTSEAIVTHGGPRRGAPVYLPPEVLLGAAPRPEGDLYSLAVVLFECLAGRPPFDPPEGREFPRAGAAPPRLAIARPELGTAFDGFFARALAWHARDRFATAGDFLAALRALDWPSRDAALWRTPAARSDFTAQLEETAPSESAATPPEPTPSEGFADRAARLTFVLALLIACRTFACAPPAGDERPRGASGASSPSAP